MVVGQAVVNPVDGAFAVGMGIVECEVVAVRHHHVALRVDELYAVLGLPAAADAVVNQRTVQVLEGIALLRGHGVEIGGISQIIIEAGREELAEVSPDAVLLGRFKQLCHLLLGVVAVAGIESFLQLVVPQLMDVVDLVLLACQPVHDARVEELL